MERSMDASAVRAAVDCTRMVVVVYVLLVYVVVVVVVVVGTR